MREPSEVMDACGMAVFTDPEGAAFCVWEAKEHKGARVVNEHGALNFNGLNTREVDGAKAFYGSVFGWKTMQLGGGVEAWTLPGYWGPSRARRPRHSRAGRLTGRARRVRGRRRKHQPDSGRPARHARTLERDFRGRRRRRHGREGRRAWRNRGRHAVRRALGPDGRRR